MKNKEHKQRALNTNTHKWKIRRNKKHQNTLEERQAKNKVTNKQQQQITITKTHTPTNSKGTHPEDWVINIHGVWIHQNKIHELRATNKITNKNKQ